VSLLPVLVVNLCFYFFVFIPALVLPFYSINYVCMYVYHRSNPEKSAVTQFTVQFQF